MARAIDPSLYRHKGDARTGASKIESEPSAASHPRGTIAFDVPRPLTPDWQPVLSTTGGLSIGVECQGPTGWVERLRMQGSAGSFRPNYQPTDLFVRLLIQSDGKTNAHISLG